MANSSTSGQPAGIALALRKTQSGRASNLAKRDQQKPRAYLCRTMGVDGWTLVITSAATTDDAQYMNTRSHLQCKSLRRGIPLRLWHIGRPCCAKTAGLVSAAPTAEGRRPTSFL